jgi:hypothetical protein
MFGVLISIAFITGSFMTSDAIVSDLFRDQLDEVEYHFKAYTWYWEGDYSSSSAVLLSMMDEVRAHEGIEDAGFFREMMSLSSGDQKIGVYGLDEGAARFVFERKDVELPDDGDGCIISSALADDLGLSLGDSFNLTYYEWKEVPVEEGDEYTRSEPVHIKPFDDGKDIWFDDQMYELIMVPINTSVNVSMILDTPGLSSLSGNIYSSAYNVYIGLEGSRLLQERIREQVEYYYDSYSNILFKINPDFFSNLDDVQATRREARELKDDLQRIVGSQNFYMEDDRIGEIYEDYIFWSITMRVFLVILSLPLFLLCFYLVLVGSRIGMENKVQEISLLKVKGATRRQIFWMLMLESLIHGSVGTLFGILLGSALSLFFIYLYLIHI